MSRQFKTLLYLSLLIAPLILTRNLIIKASESTFSASEFSRYCERNSSTCKKENLGGRSGSISCPGQDQQISKIYIHAGDGQKVYELPDINFSAIYSPNQNSATITNSSDHDFSWIAALCSSVPATPTPLLCQVRFNQSDFLLCDQNPRTLQVSGTVVNAPDGSFLQKAWHIVAPADKATQTSYQSQATFSGQEFTQDAQWPGIRSDDSFVEVHFGANILDQNHNPYPNCTASLDYYWYPDRCPLATATSTPAPTQTPTQNPTPLPTSPCSPQWPTCFPVITLPPIITLTPTPTVTPVDSPTPTATTALPTNTPGPTDTPSSPTNTPEPGPTNTPGPGPTDTPGPGPTDTPQPSSHSTASPSNGTVLGIGGGEDNLILSGLRESFIPGTVLGVSSLPGTADNRSLIGNQITGNQKIGLKLTIPSLGIDTDIYRSQKIGSQILVGHQEVLLSHEYSPTLLYSHNGTDIFGQIYTLTPGSEITLNQFDTPLKYQVESIKYISSANSDYLNSLPADYLVLLTCSATYPDQRILIISKPVL